MTGQRNSHVLVVDDEAAVRELTIRALDRAGFECAPAINGEQALKMMEIQRFDAVITDLRMPSVHGHALAVELLSRSDRPVVIVVTGVLEPKLARDLLQRGVDDIFFKPVDHQILALKLTMSIQNRRESAKAAVAAEPALA
jgi:DNA-binding NtrC family response regulator